MKIAVSPAKPTAFAVRLRIPGWAQGHPVPTDLYSYEPGEAKWSVRVNNQEVTGTLEQGYLTIDRQWQADDIVDVDFSMPVRLVHGDEKIAATRGQVAFERGPIVYCVEAVQQELPATALASPIGAVSEESVREVLNGAVTLQIKPANLPAFTAIPYYAWNNRGLARMTVWLNQEPAPAPGNAAAKE